MGAWRTRAAPVCSILSSTRTIMDSDQWCELDNNVCNYGSGRVAGDQSHNVLYHEILNNCSYYYSQTNLLTNKYERLIKDKAIISAEVMHEYDEKVSHLKFLHMSYSLLDNNSYSSLILASTLSVQTNAR